MPATAQHILYFWILQNLHFICLKYFNNIPGMW